MTGRFLRLAAIAAVAFVAAGCGSSNEEADTAEPVEAALTSDPIAEVGPTPSVCDDDALGEIIDAFGRFYSTYQDANKAQAGLAFDMLSDSLIDFHGDLEAAGETATATRIRTYVEDIPRIKQSDYVEQMEWIGEVIDTLELEARKCADLEPGSADARRSEFLDEP